MNNLSNQAVLSRSIMIVLILAMVTTFMTLLISTPITIITHEKQSCKIEDSQFSLSWIHSVDKTPWTEQYQRTNKGFLLTHSIFRTFGAGVPHEGNVLASEDGMIHYEMNQLIDEINWVIDKEVRSTIILPDHKIWEIYQNSPRYSEVQFRNQSLNFWQRLLMRNCHES